MDMFRKTDCALRLLAMLATDDTPLLSVRNAAEQVGIPYSFARSIQHGLAQAGIVESLRGVRGGMRLAADPVEITLRQVVEAVQGPQPADEGQESDPAADPALEACCYDCLWTGAKALLQSYLDSVTLDDVINHRENPAVDPMFADRLRFGEYAGGDLAEKPSAA